MILRLNVPAVWSFLVVLSIRASMIAGEEAGAPSEIDRYWAQWRGPRGTGVAPHADPPIRWSEKENIRWRVELPGRGHSSPIVWDDRIFVMAAVPHGDSLPPQPDNAPGAHDNLLVTHRHRFVVIAVARDDGRILWERTVREELPHEGGHITGSLASASPVTDGESVFAFFGSRGLYAFDLGGEPQWKLDFGRMATLHGHGEGASPVIWKDLLIVNWDHQDESFIVALDKKSGKERWKKKRDEITSWASPIVYEHDGKSLLIVSGTNRIRGYDPATGEVLWECGGLSDNVIATPVAANGMVFAGSSYDKQALIAIRLEGARGDITSTDHVAWKRTRATPYVPSPLLYGESLYFLRHYQGVLHRVEARTGNEPKGPFRLEGIGNIYASPVAAAGRIYITDREGRTIVLRHGETPETLAVNRLDDRINATAALVDREIFLRGERYLWAIAEK
jgi:outer membrane protein assembly factor BamB